LYGTCSNLTADVSSHFPWTGSTPEALGFLLVVSHESNSNIDSASVDPGTGRAIIKVFDMSKNPSSGMYMVMTGTDSATKQRVSVPSLNVCSVNVCLQSELQSERSVTCERALARTTSGVRLLPNEQHRSDVDTQHRRHPHSPKIAAMSDTSETTSSASSLFGHDDCELHDVSMCKSRHMSHLTPYL